jgi:hypothetical protein
MSVKIVVMPTGPKATPEAIENWKQAGQKVANENDAEVEIIGRNDNGTIISHLIAQPERQGLFGRRRV